MTTLVSVPGIMGNMPLATAQSLGYTNYTPVPTPSPTTPIAATLPPGGVVISLGTNPTAAQAAAATQTLGQMGYSVPTTPVGQPAPATDTTGLTISYAIPSTAQEIVTSGGAGVSAETLTQAQADVAAGQGDSPQAAISYIQSTGTTPIIDVQTVVKDMGEAKATDYLAAAGVANPEQAVKDTKTAIVITDLKPIIVPRIDVWSSTGQEVVDAAKVAASNLGTTVTDPTVAQALGISTAQLSHANELVTNEAGNLSLASAVPPKEGSIEWYQAAGQVVNIGRPATAQEIVDSLGAGVPQVVLQQATKAVKTGEGSSPQVAINYIAEKTGQAPTVDIAQIVNEMGAEKATSYLEQAGFTDAPTLVASVIKQQEANDVLKYYMTNGSMDYTQLLTGIRNNGEKNFKAMLADAGFQNVDKFITDARAWAKENNWQPGLSSAIKSPTFTRLEGAQAIQAAQQKLWEEWQAKIDEKVANLNQQATTNEFGGTSVHSSILNTNWVNVDKPTQDIAKEVIAGLPEDYKDAPAYWNSLTDEQKQAVGASQASTLSGWGAVKEGATVISSMIPIYGTIKFWNQMPTWAKALSVAGDILTVVPLVAMTARELRPVSVIVPTETGDVTVWKGVAPGGKPLWGVSRGSLTFGDMGVKYPEDLFAAAKAGYEPVTKVENSLLGTTRALKKMGASDIEINRAMATLGERGEFAGKVSPYLSRTSPLPTVERLTQDEVGIVFQATKDYGKKIDKVFGTVSLEPQLPEDLKMWRGKHDIDIQTAMKQEETNLFTKDILERLQAKGNPSDYRIASDAPGAIEKKINGVWQKITDIHSTEEVVPGSAEVSPTSREGSYGMMHHEKAVTVEYPGIGKVDIMTASEMGKRKAQSILRWQKGTFAPYDYRIKDITDFYVIDRTFRGADAADAWARAYGFDPAELLKAAQADPPTIVGWQFTPEESKLGKISGAVTGISPSVTIHIPKVVQSLSPVISQTSSSVKSLSIPTPTIPKTEISTSKVSTPVSSIGSGGISEPVKPTKGSTSSAPSKTTPVSTAASMPGSTEVSSPSLFEAPSKTQPSTSGGSQSGVASPPSVIIPSPISPISEISETPSGELETYPSSMAAAQSPSGATVASESKPATSPGSVGPSPSAPSVQSPSQPSGKSPSSPSGASPSSPSVASPSAPSGEAPTPPSESVGPWRGRGKPGPITIKEVEGIPKTDPAIIQLNQGIVKIRFHPPYREGSEDVEYIKLKTPQKGRGSPQRTLQKLAGNAPTRITIGMGKVDLDIFKGERLAYPRRGPGILNSKGKMMKQRRGRVIE